MLLTTFAKNLRLPQKSIAGRFVKHFLLRINGKVEIAAVEHCNIKPDYYVLEVGFGPGLGLEAAYQKIKGGKGKLHGLDLSPYMFELTSKRLSEGISNKQVELHLGSVMEMPFETNSFDRIFHCNSFYFWPDFDKCIQELHRCLKPNSLMITTIQYEKVKLSKKFGLLKYGNIDVEYYMKVLSKNKFENVNMESRKYQSKPYQVISAFTGSKKQ
ncbi:demethylmenaquinone methyltransferase [Octopus bimaculoides]|uniref:demethylmenaquinone methyltransferase n=1 Tax=Octopus bimaculoides TaxID=37653 RepID=UPI00071D3F68|nr:demethylmenaquinone methyltransferase [Octopus bimaculoides]|eukprot:XP_014782918.1 PREDICTED: demethylmenaquinone methyltransferase-like [Octopus bimaculoides]